MDCQDYRKYYQILMGYRSGTIFNVSETVEYNSFFLLAWTSLSKGLLIIEYFSWDSYYNIIGLYLSEGLKCNHSKRHQVISIRDWSC